MCIDYILYNRYDTIVLHIFYHMTLALNDKKWNKIFNRH